jgi:signal transduction histidine kinase
MPIRRKLWVILTLTTAGALIFAGFAIVAVDTWLFYNFLKRDLVTFATVIGDNASAALAFEDAIAGKQTLDALRARTHVQTACLYRTDGTLLTHYARPGYIGRCPGAQGEQVRTANGALIVSHQIYVKDGHVGALALQYDLGEIWERVQLYGATVVLAMLLASIIALLLSKRLRALIAEPILDLARMANAISQTKNYAIRTEKTSADEVGVMANALNEMLDGIQSRDSNLRDTLAQLSQVNAELERSNKDLERFAFVASHDLQEPLRMITTYSQLLVAEHSVDPKGDAREAQYVAHIVSGNRRMRELLSDLLAYTEMVGSAEQPTEVVDLNVVLHYAQGALGARIAETHAVITVSMLPVLNAHASRMNSLFLNLLGNALKYRGDRAARVRVWAEQAGDMFQFSIADNGIGIAPEDQKKIFEPFKRLHGREIPGTGIGLAICQRIVEHYGGQIWVESDLGYGSTFRFTLPKSMEASGV